MAPIKRLTIPRLKLCGAHSFCTIARQCFTFRQSRSSLKTDSTVVLNWLISNPRRFKAYVGNRISHIIELIAPERWGHVEGISYPADCASRGMQPVTLSSRLNSEN